jgi:type IV pilus assembly protein PilO
MGFVDKIQKIPVKTRLYSFVGFLCVLGGLFIYFIYIPMISDIRKNEKVLAETETTIRNNDERIKKLAELEQEVVTLNAKLKVLSEQLPQETEVSTLLGEIQGLVNKSGLTLKLWKPEKRRTHSSGLYEEIPISVDLIGGYHNVGVFFDSIGKVKRIVNILNIKMGQPKAGPDGAMEIIINCTAMTFAAAEKKVETAPKTPAKKTL